MKKRIVAVILTLVLTLGVIIVPAYGTDFDPINNERSIQVQEFLPYLSLKYGIDDRSNFISPIEKIESEDDWIAITDRRGLESIKNNLDAQYYLAADIDLSDSEWTPI